MASTRQPVTTSQGTQLDAVSTDGVYSISGLAQGMSPGGDPVDVAVDDNGRIMVDAAAGVATAYNDGVRKAVSTTSTQLAPARKRRFLLMANIEGPGIVFVRPSASAASATEGIPIPVGGVLSLPSWDGPLQVIADAASYLMVVEY